MKKVILKLKNYKDAICVLLQKIIICVTDRERQQGEYLPSAVYGLSYIDYAKYNSHYAIIPINYFIKWHRSIRFFWDRIRSRLGYVDKIIEGERYKAQCEWREYYVNELLESKSESK